LRKIEKLSNLSSEISQSILDLNGSENEKVVASSSMEPALKPGDKITIEPVNPDDIVPGMVIVYRKNGRMIVHRVIKKNENNLVTAGDNLRKYDKPVHISQVLGKVKGLSVLKPLSRFERFFRAIKRRLVRS
jgi:signal peptidase I